MGDVQMVRCQRPFDDGVDELEVLAARDGLAVTADPAGRGFALVVTGVGKYLCGHRFATLAQATSAAERLADLTDFTAVTGKTKARKLAGNATVAAQLRRLLDHTLAGVIAPPVPDYGPPTRTGVSYEPGYDERRRARRR